MGKSFSHIFIMMLYKYLMHFEVAQIFCSVQFTLRVTTLPDFWAGVVKSFELYLEAISLALWPKKKKKKNSSLINWMLM